MLKRLLIVATLLLAIPTLASALPPSGGSASCIYCHDGDIPTGEGGSGCGGCHKNPPATGAHQLHTDGANAVYGSDSNASAAVYRFNCGNCHSTNSAMHGNGGVEVELYNTAATGFKKNNPATASSSGSGDGTTCINIYCHSSGRFADPSSYVATPMWGGGFAGNRCSGCHSYPPDYANKAPKANSHVPHSFSCDTCHAGTTSDGTTITNASLHVNHSYDVTPGPGVTFTYSYAVDGGNCSNISCHGNTDATWGGTAVCTACHGSPPPAAAAGYSGVNEATSPHLKHAGDGTNYGYACSQCHKGNKHGNGTFQDVFIDKSGILAGQSASYDTGTRTCSSLYCHSDGTTVATGLPVSATVAWGANVLSCNGCHSSPPAYGNGSPKANSHVQHGFTCNTCHAGTAASGNSINDTSLHVNGSYNVSPGNGVSFSYTYSANGGTCSNISCHGNTGATWGGTAACLVCHSVKQGSRGAVTGQFSANSHHVQGTVDNSKCYQCHWEANSDGSINSTYHHSSTTGAPIELVIYGAGSRPSTYVAGVTAIQYTANGSRSEIAKINSHCLGCHSDQNNSTIPFADGKTPRQYAWDNTSIAARYGQSGVTTWGKYPATANAAKKNISKAYSAHGNSAANQRGWDTTNGVDGSIANTSGAINVQCYDCHNSHGSTATGATTRYTSATVNGGILKDTASGEGGYAVAYKPEAGGSASTKSSRSAGASLCLDCHLNRLAEMTPWGFNSTYGASEPILGYWDAPMYGNYSTAGAQKRFAYKDKNLTMGGHFGASFPLSSSPSTAINGLCTPCHDPHGVSPTLGSMQQYAVPLLKGTWMTSPYKEDVAPANNAWFTNFAGYGEGVQYHIDQNTFGSGIRSSVTGISQTVEESEGLCLGCHPKDTLTATASQSSPNPWKSKNRVHEAVKGWKSSNGTVKHNYTCSKCHSPHSNSVLPRLMITDCLDGRHKGRMGNNTAPVISGWSSGDDGSGSGRIPGSYSGGGYYDDGPGNGLPAPGDVTVTCHDSATANGYGTTGTDQGWNSVTPWIDAAPTISSGPFATSGNLRVFLHMDEASWNGTQGEVKDSSGGNNNGTSYNGANTVAGGVSGRAGSFNNSSVAINYASGVPPVDNFTMEAWIKPTTSHQIDAQSTTGTGGVSGQRYLFKPDHKGASDGGAGISAGTNGISVYEHGSNYMPALAVYSGSISSSQWTHVAVVYINKQPRIYVNGNLVRTGLQSTREHVHAPRVIGVGDYGNFPGLVDEVAIYERPLSATEVLSHYQLSYPDSCNDSEMTVSWNTNVNSNSYVDYGYTTAYGATSGSEQLTSSHSLKLTGLSPGATYHYRVRSRTVGGSEVSSGDNTFVMGSCVSYQPLPVPSPVPQSDSNSSGGSVAKTFQWGGVTAPDGDQVEYLVEVSATAAFSSVAYQSSWQSNTSWTQSLPIGDWYWRVTARDSVHVASTSSPSAADGFSISRISAPSLTPLADSTSSGGNVAKTFQWSTVTCADGDSAQFNIEVSSSSAFTTIAYSSGWTTSMNWTQSMPIGTWYWRVTARDGIHTTLTSLPSTTASFSIIPPAPQAPVPTLQATSYVIGSGATSAISLQWSAVSSPDGDPCQYQVDVSAASNFSTVNYQSQWQTGTGWTQSIPAGTWYWRVKVRDSVHILAASTSATSSFSIIDRTPLPPTLVANAGAIGSSADITLQWNTVASPDGDAVQFWAELSTTSNFSAISYSTPSWQTATSWTRNLTAGTWYWRVRARDSVHTTAVSANSANGVFAITDSSTQSWTTPGTYTYVVPAGISSLNITLKGAGGAGGLEDNVYNQSAGSAGDLTSTVVPITPGSQLTVYVAAGGSVGNIQSNAPGAGGFGYHTGASGQAGAGVVSNGAWAYGGSGGGGSSAVTLSSTLLAEAAGGRGGKSSDYDDDYEWYYDGGYYVGGSGGLGGGSNFPAVTAVGGGGAGGGFGATGGNGSVTISLGDWTPPQTTLTPVATSYVIGSGATSAFAFQWSTVTAPDGNACQYQVDVSGSSSFTAIAYQSPWQSGTGWSQSLPVGTWYWRVKARNVVHTSAVSTSVTGSFGLVDRTPAVPMLNPQSDSTTSGSSMSKTFQWSAVPSPDGDAVQYLAEMSATPNFLAIAYSSGWTAASSWTQVTATGTWYWRVTARDSVHTTAVSSPSASDSFNIINGSAGSTTVTFPVYHHTDCTLSGGVYDDDGDIIWAGPFDGWDVDRSFLMFDTSSLGSGVTVTSVKLYLNFQNRDYMDYGNVTGVHESTWNYPGSSSTYSNVGALLASNPVSWNQAFGPTVFNIRADYVNRLGTTKFAVIAADEDYDALYNADPGYSRASSYLEITYTTN